MRVLVVGSLSWQWTLVSKDCWEGSLKSWKDPTPFPIRLLAGRRPVSPGFAGSRDKWYRGAAKTWSYLVWHFSRFMASASSSSIMV